MIFVNYAKISYLRFKGNGMIVLINEEKILLFELNGLLRKTLLEQILLNKEFEVAEASSFDDIKCQLSKSSFDLIIIGTDSEAYGLSSIDRFIKEAKIKNIVLFMIDEETSGALSFEESKGKHYFIERPFRIQHLNKKISRYLLRYQTQMS